MRFPILLLALPLTIGATQAPPVPCPAPTPPLSESRAPSLAAATDTKSLVQAKLTVGKRIEAMLAATDTVRYVLTPAKPAAPGSVGGMLSLTITLPGTYRVAIGTGAWVDLVRRGKALKSIAHDHAPACSAFRKMVDFALTPGRYVLQMEGSKDANTPVLVTRLR